MYATPWSIKLGNQWFYDQCWGISQKIIGLNLNNEILHYQLPRVKEFMSEAAYEEAKGILEKN